MYALDFSINLYSFPTFILLVLDAQNNILKDLSSYAQDSITIICFDTHLPSNILFAIFVAKIWLQSIHEFYPKLSKTHDDLLFCILLRNITHKYIRYFKFPMLFGMEPVNWLAFRSLHPKMHTWVRWGENFSVYYIMHALRSGVHLFRFPPIIYLGLGAQNHLFTTKSSYALENITLFDTYAPTNILFAIFPAKIWFQGIHFFCP